jgi:hypothetical protein
MSPYLEHLVTLGSLGVLMWGMLKFMLRDIHKDLADIKEQMKRAEVRMDKNDLRSDHLYQICIDMLKARK